MLYALLGFILGLVSVESSDLGAKERIHIAVASNFLRPMKTLSKDFSQRTKIGVLLSKGPTGMLYAQIKRGAPYDLFFAADVKRPKGLEEEGLIEAGSRFTYAKGKLVSWSKNFSPDLNLLNPNNPQLRFVAIANPKTAPYGKAALEVLNHFGIGDSLKKKTKLAYGENVGKAYHYVASGNAQIGLVALSYLAHSKKNQGKIYEIPQNTYSEIIQQAAILKGRKSGPVLKFLEYLNSLKAKKIIRSYGYDLGKS